MDADPKAPLNAPTAIWQRNMAGVKPARHYLSAAKENGGSRQAEKQKK